ncbi:MAG: erythromycin esterase family protein [Desulforhopalus sp.]|nr:erythromycin esterase family protein [Desulforhopalus sp.]
MRSLIGRLMSIFVLQSIVILALPGFTHAGETATGQEQAGRQLPVYATDAGKGLPYMIELMRGRKAFLLGDATHGTEEFYAFRKRVTRHLIRDLGVRVVVLEAEWDGGKMVDEYIRGLLPGTVCARQLLPQAFKYWPVWVWANEELVEFVEWLKEFNSHLPPDKMVRCRAMDMQFAIGAALESLAGVWPADSRHGRIYDDLRRWWRQYEDYPMRYNFAYAEGRDTGNLMATELLSDLPAGDKEWRQRLIMLIAAEEYYRVMSYNQYESWNIRSRHFSGYIEDILQEPEGAKGVVVWAHNSHVGDMSATDVQGTGLTSFGALLRERLGKDQVFILGSAGYSGTVLAAIEWYQDPVEMVVPPAAPGSLEAILDSGGWDNSLLVFEDDEQREKWSMPLLHRGIGVAYNAQAEMPSYYLTARISSRYDAVVFWRKTRSLQLMADP